MNIHVLATQIKHYQHLWSLYVPLFNCTYCSLPKRSPLSSNLCLTFPCLFSIIYCINYLLLITNYSKTWQLKTMNICYFSDFVVRNLRATSLNGIISRSLTRFQSRPQPGLQTSEGSTGAGDIFQRWCIHKAVGKRHQVLATWTLLLSCLNIVRTWHLTSWRASEPRGDKEKATLPLMI